jgi:hypothetical protein
VVSDLLPNEDVEHRAGDLDCPHCSTVVPQGVWRCPECHHRVRFIGGGEIQESDGPGILGGLAVIELLVLMVVALVWVVTWVTSPQNPLGQRLLVGGSLIAPILYGFYLARK